MTCESLITSPDIGRIPEPENARELLVLTTDPIESLEGRKRFWYSDTQNRLHVCIVPLLEEITCGTLSHRYSNVDGHWQADDDESRVIVCEPNYR
ncbi:MAG: hypothetical protein ACREO1_14920 [Arenimonas sp.]